MIDWGCGDGTVLDLITDDVQYLGVDLSPTIVERHTATYADNPNKWFVLADEVTVDQMGAELCVSADVLHHFGDEVDFMVYLADLFGSASRFVAIWATDHDGGQTAHHCFWRNFTDVVAESHPGWHLEATQQGRRTKTIDPTEPAWYLYAPAQPPAE